MAIPSRTSGYCVDAYKLRGNSHRYSGGTVRRPHLRHSTLTRSSWPRSLRNHKRTSASLPPSKVASICATSSCVTPIGPGWHTHWRSGTPWSIRSPFRCWPKQSPAYGHRRPASKRSAGPPVRRFLPRSWRGRRPGFPSRWRSGKSTNLPSATGGRYPRSPTRNVAGLAAGHTLLRASSGWCDCPQSRPGEGRTAVRMWPGRRWRAR